MKREQKFERFWLPLALAAGVMTLGSAAQAESPTYYKDVLPIFQQKCQTCHRPGQLAPITFDSYEEVRPWAKSIRRVVQDRTMPPWHADPKYGTFSNSMGLDESEILTITQWASLGARPGAESDAPEAVEFSDDWSIGTPDAIYSMPTSYTLGAEGNDEYKYFTIDPGLTEDKWVTHVEVRPGNRAVVHHVIAFIDESGGDARDEGGIVPINSKRPTSPEQLARTLKRQDEKIQPRVKEAGLKARPFRDFALLGGIAPGTPPISYPEGQAKLLKAGSKLIFQMHYSRTGKVEVDQTSIGVRFSNTPPKMERKMTAVMNVSFAIPPNAPNHQVHAYHTTDRPILIHNFMPHLHLRGVGFRYEATYPDGETEILLNIPEYDFNWQYGYELAEPKYIPAGTLLHCVGFFDNSAENAANPDPEAIVRFGEPTVDEMMIGWMEITELPKDAPAPKQVAEESKDLAFAR